MYRYIFPMGAGLCLCLLLVCPIRLSAQQPPEQKGIKQLLKKERLMATFPFEGWSVRVTRELYGSLKARALRYTTRYYLRKKGEKKEKLVYQMKGTYWKKIYTVREDGTMLLGRYSTLTWVFPSGKQKDEQLQVNDKDARVVKAWSDGLLLRPRELNEQVSVFFVPIEGQGEKTFLDFAHKKKITSGSGIFHRDTILRSGSFLVWLMKRSSDQTVAICVHDLKTSRSDCFQYQKKYLHLHSFKNPLVILKELSDYHVFDVANGRLVGVTDVPNLPLAERGKVQYYLFRTKIDPPKQTWYYRYSIMAVDLKTSKPQTKTLWERKFSTGHPQPKVTPTGIQVQQGKETVIVPWLKTNEEKSSCKD